MPVPELAKSSVNPGNIGQSNLPAPKGMALPAAFLKKMKRKKFLPSIQLVQSMSKVRKDYKPSVNGPTKPEEGMFWLGADKLLGDFDSRDAVGQFEAVCVGAMPHALHIKEGKAVLESFDADESLWQKIEQLQPDKASRGQTRSLIGGDVLFYFPETDSYAIYFMHSTASETVIDAFGCIGRTVKVRSKVVGNKFKWYVPGIDDVGPGTGNHDEELEKFLNREGRKEDKPVEDDGR